MGYQKGTGTRSRIGLQDTKYLEISIGTNTGTEMYPVLVPVPVPTGTLYIVLRAGNKVDILCGAQKKSLPVSVLR
jgi:hypothetical protein